VLFEKTATRLWRRLQPEERLQAATAFWEQPPEEALGAALGAIVKARRLRPQVARSLPLEARARILASHSDPGETVAAALLVALHLAHRRTLLATFLNAAGLAHEDGVLRDEVDETPLGAEAARRGATALAAAFPPEQVRVYLNTLWLQDPERWAVLEQTAGSGAGAG